MIAAARGERWREAELPASGADPSVVFIVFITTRCSTPSTININAHNHQAAKREQLR